MAHIISPDGSIIINAILTKAGRQKLASGVNAFNITKFAVSDDQVDYSIEGLQNILQESPETYPILEPVSNGDLMLKTKLYTDYNINSGTRLLAFIDIPNLSQLITNNITAIAGGKVTYTPSTAGSATETYTITLDFSKGQPFSSIEYAGSQNNITVVPSESMNVSLITINNVSFITFVRKELTAPIYFKMSVTGIKTGATGTYTFKVNPSSSATAITTQA